VVMLVPVVAVRRPFAALECSQRLAACSVATTLSRLPRQPGPHCHATKLRPPCLLQVVAERAVGEDDEALSNLGPGDELEVRSGGPSGWRVERGGGLSNSGASCPGLQQRAAHGAAPTGAAPPGCPPPPSPGIGPRSGGRGTSALADPVGPRFFCARRSAKSWAAASPPCSGLAPASRAHWRCVRPILSSQLCVQRLACLSIPIPRCMRTHVTARCTRICLLASLRLDSPLHMRTRDRLRMRTCMDARAMPLPASTSRFPCARLGMRQSRAAG